MNKHIAVILMTSLLPLTAAAQAPVPKAFLIANIEVSDAETYKQYLPLSSKAVEAYGGRFLVRGGKPFAPEGELKPTRMVVLEFQSMEQLKKFYYSREYQEALKIRQQASKSPLYVFLEGAAP
jgi:uncharacterized protein (DUF1330 family)